jgi:O-antigen/teichoic acid export membrane protein
MNSFWDNLYDKFKDRRYGILFVLTLLAFVGLLILAVIIVAILCESNWEDYFLDALPGIGLLALAWGF